jgi:glycosyltransferase involved in cell wall biosynthesis
MRLLVVSHTPHYRQNGHYVGWGPTVRELDFLAQLFDEVVHVAPVYREPPPSSALPYSPASRIQFRPIPPAGGPNLIEKLSILRAYPRYAAAIRAEMQKVDAIHVRCPANISLLALLLLRQARQPLYRWVKYAGNWQPDGGEPWSYRLQRRWLTENRHHGVVTVNGVWPYQPSHIFSFFNPCLTDEEIEEGSAGAATKELTLPIELLFVGALNEGKGVSQVLRMAQLLQARNIPYRLRLLGDGPDRPGYEAWSRRQGLEGVNFLGWVPRTEMASYYSQAHFILLPSRSEGWPKVLSEAMAYGTVPVAAAVSSIPQILGATRAGVSFAPDDISGMASAIADFIEEPASWKRASRAGVVAARQFTYRSYQDAVRNVFTREWGVQLATLPENNTLGQALPGNRELSGAGESISRNGYGRNY